MPLIGQILMSSYSRVPMPSFSACSRQLIQSVSGWRWWKWSWPQSPAAAAPLLVFCLLYTPCIAAVASVKRELGGRWALTVVVGQCAIAYAAALVVRLIGLALGVA